MTLNFYHEVKIKVITVRPPQIPTTFVINFFLLRPSNELIIVKNLHKPRNKSQGYFISIRQIL